GINFNNPIEGIPAFLCILFMTFSSSVANGVMMGVMAHVGLYLILGRFREIPLSMWIISLVFAIKVML
ncbi:MAG: NCS2 family permease, partial [bacterium]|nr:NCS2 family permease [bacterium]